MSNMRKIKYPKAIEGRILTKKKFKIKDASQLIEDTERKREGSHEARHKEDFKLEKIFKQIDKNLIYLPAFQRDTSWRIIDRVKLLNFMLYGRSYLVPLAMNRLSLNTAQGEYTRLDEHRTPITPEQMQAELEAVSKTNDAIKSLVDGWQRVSTLNFCRTGTKEVETIFYDVLKAEFINTTRPKHSCIHVYELLCDDKHQHHAFVDNFVSSLSKPNQVVVAHDLLTVRNNLRTYDFQILETSDLNISKELDWYKKLNDSGVNLSTAQLEMSDLMGLGFRFSQFAADFRAITNTGYWYTQGIDLMPKLATQVTMPAASFTVPTEIIIENGQKSSHSLGYSPILSDQKTKIWGTEWVTKKATTTDPMKPVKIADKMASASLLVLKTVVDFWDVNNIQKAGLKLTNTTSEPMRFRREHVLYLHGYIFWKHAAEFVQFMNDDTKEAADAKIIDFKLDQADESYIINWMKNNSFHDLSHPKKRALFDKFIR